MKIGAIITGDVEVIHPESTLDEAAAKMKRFDIGLLPVCDGDQLVGIVTDRDITVRSVAHSENPTWNRVRDIMTPEVISCYEDDNVVKGAQLMREKQIHRVLVLNRDQGLVGVVSLEDLAAESGNGHLAGETLKGASDPTVPQTDEPAAQVQPEAAHVLSEIRDLAQKVGGWKQLAEIAECLQVTTE